MKQILKIKHKIIFMMMSILGFSSCSPLDMYGVPNANYKLQGTITNEEGESIKGIHVSIVKDDVYNPINTSSSATGKFDLSQNSFPDNNKKVTYLFKDTDGEENGGDFADKTIEIVYLESDKTEKGDNAWYAGTFSKEITVTLTQKR